MRSPSRVGQQPSRLSGARRRTGARAKVRDGAVSLWADGTCDWIECRHSSGSWARARTLRWSKRAPVRYRQVGFALGDPWFTVHCAPLAGGCCACSCMGAEWSGGTRVSGAGTRFDGQFCQRGASRCAPLSGVGVRAKNIVGIKVKGESASPRSCPPPAAVVLVLSGLVH